jgi:hypothetical protein
LLGIISTHGRVLRERVQKSSLLLRWILPEPISVDILEFITI